MRWEIVGEPFRMFDFLPVGLGLAVAGVAFLTFGYKLLPPAGHCTASMDAAFNIEAYTAEVRVPDDSPSDGKTVDAIEALGEGEGEIATILLERYRRYTPDTHGPPNAD